MSTIIELGGKLHLPIRQGETFSLTVEQQTPEGVAIAFVTGATAKMQGRRYADSPDPVLFEASTANGRITVDAPNGKLVITIPASVTVALSGGGAYDLEVTEPASPENVVTRLLEGTFTVSPNVTK